jgi:ankyrin repeat protein
MSYVGPNEILPGIFKYVDEDNKCWGTVRKLIRRRSDLILTRSSLNLTFLSYCISHEAPLDLLSLINKQDPSQILDFDVYGANACHIACINSASPKIMKWIISRNSDLVSLTDVDKRLPIHHLAESICRDEIQAKRAIKVMNAMIKVNPEILSSGDVNGNTVIDQLQLDIMHFSKYQEKHKTRLRNLEQVCAFLRQKSIEAWLIRKKASECC